jgi:hypothetical protein
MSRWLSLPPESGDGSLLRFVPDFAGQMGIKTLLLVIVCSTFAGGTWIRFVVYDALRQGACEHFPA